MNRSRRIVSTVIVFLAVFGVWSSIKGKNSSAKAASVEAPKFEVDPLWPKPLPNHWVLGATVGVAVDSQDHIWIVHRQNTLEKMETYAQQTPVAGECCVAAPPVLEFDEEGNLIGHWGGPGPGYDWPVSMHGITVDYKGNVWIGGNGNGLGGTRVTAGANSRGSRRTWSIQRLHDSEIYSRWQVPYANR